MKHLLRLVLIMPWLPMAAHAAAPPVQPQAHADGEQDPAVRRRQLIEVKFVLVRPPPDQRESPQFEFGNGRSAIEPMSLRGSFAVPLNVGYMNPNMYWCSGWACMDFRN